MGNGNEAVWKCTNNKIEITVFIYYYLFGFNLIGAAVRRKCVSSVSRSFQAHDFCFCFLLFFSFSKSDVFFILFISFEKRACAPSHPCAYLCTPERILYLHVINQMFEIHMIERSGMTMINQRGRARTKTNLSFALFIDFVVGCQL